MHPQPPGEPQYGEGGPQYGQPGPQPQYGQSGPQYGQPGPPPQYGQPGPPPQYGQPAAPPQYGQGGPQFGGAPPQRPAGNEAAAFFNKVPLVPVILVILLVIALAVGLPRGGGGIFGGYTTSKSELCEKYDAARDAMYDTYTVDVSDEIEDLIDAASDYDDEAVRDDADALDNHSDLTISSSAFESKTRNIAEVCS